MRVFGLEVRRAPAQAVPESRGGWWPLVREPFAGAWQRNREWTSDSVLRQATVYGCVSLIAQDVGKLRPKLVEQGEGGVWREVQNTAHSPVLQRPNRFQNHIQFKEAWVTSKLIHGNAYVLLRRDARRVVDAMYLLDPTRVKVLVAPDGEVFYELRADNLAGMQEDRPAVPASEIIHDRMNALFHPLVGTSPILASGMAAHMGLRIQDNSTAFFGNGSNLSGVLSAPQSITPQKAKELTEVWNSHAKGDLSGFVAVLGDGLKFEAMRMSAVDAQLIDQLRWTDEVICRTFHVPPFKLGIGPQASYQNPEALNGIYYSDCLQSHIESWELCMDEALGLTTPKEGRRLGVELDLDGLLRMDTATHVETLTKGVRGGLYTPNEARRKVDAPPLEGGDTIYLQHQDYPMEKVFNRTDLDPAPEPPDPPQTQAVIADSAEEAEEAARALLRSLVPVLQAHAEAVHGRVEAAMEDLRQEVGQLRAGLVAPPAEEEEPAVVPERWEGWFARDALQIHQELAQLGRAAPPLLLAPPQPDSAAELREAVEQMRSAVTAALTREIPPSVVHVAPAEVTVTPPAVHVTVEAPKAGRTRTVELTNSRGTVSRATITEE